MDEKEYIKSLENLLIFMCKNYTETIDILCKLAQEGNDTLFKVPAIQGIMNVIKITQIGSLEVKDVKYGFKDVLKEIQNKRGVPNE